MTNFGSLNFIIDFILYPDISGYLLLIKIVFFIISFVFLAGICILVFKSTWARRFIFEDITETVTARPYGAKKAFKEWVKTKARLETGKESEYKLALIEADDLLDDILKKMGYKGDNLGEKLSKMDYSVLPSLDSVLVAHKIRNSVVHNVDSKLSKEEAKKSLDIYGKAFEEMEIF